MTASTRLTAAERSARGRAAARARSALSPATMTEAREAVFRKFLAAIDAVAPRLPSDERHERARLLRASWLSVVGIRSSQKRRGLDLPDLELDVWLAERIASAQKRTAAAPHATATVLEDERDAAAPASKEERRVADVPARS
jgi:hypothetical protein